MSLKNKTAEMIRGSFVLSYFQYSERDDKTGTFVEKSYSFSSKLKRPIGTRLIPGGCHFAANSNAFTSSPPGAHAFTIAFAIFAVVMYASLSSVQL